LNESLCRALLEARLTEEDIAAQLQVDPKTVRRWLEGRMPYPRHRWAISAMLGLDETSLWPQLRSIRSRPDEVQAVYPRLDAVPEDVWLQLIGSAERDIGILTEAADPFVTFPRVLEALAQKAGSGIRVRICLPNPDSAPDAGTRRVLANFAPLRERGDVDIRLYAAIIYNAIFVADNEMLVGQRAHGVAAGRGPVLHLRGAEGEDDMVSVYLLSFADVWAGARQW
jgi:phosphatidylserine/phosphatidylglycerophosphate/cardiolipin synthase-like enzyme